jgi:signal transduction histidine kinase
MADILRTGGGVHEYRFRRRDGSFRWMRDDCRLVRDREGNPLEIVGYWIDVTEQRQGEERLREANRELQSFVATVSHDLRTPLTPIIGYAEYLQEKCRDRLDESALAVLREIEGQGRRMMAVMEDLLVLSQVGNVPPPDRPVEVGAIVTEVLRALDEPIQRQGIVVTVKKLLALAIPPTFLTQIFANLVGNAIRYAGGAGARIDIGGRECDDLQIIDIRDYGPGIPPEERERVFEPFYRGTTAGQTRGTGIGLATVRKIVRLYGGRIWVDETPGGGSIFRMEFPIPRPG